MEANQNNDTPSNDKPFSTGEETSFLRVFYKAAITLAFLALLLSASYLFYYLYKSPNPGDITNPTTMASFNADRRMTLISTAFFVALSFGFLGFALFLINAKGEIEGEGNIGDYKVRITKFSPGLVIIVCSTIIICVCSNFKINYSTDFTLGSSYGSDSQKKPAGSTTFNQDDDVPSDSILPQKNKQ